MERTTRLDLPYIMAAQAQKHVTHNEAIRALDALIQASAKSRILADPPAAPEEGEGYIIASSATGDWLGADGKIAVFQDGAWAQFEPRKGWLVWIEEEAQFLVHDGVQFTPLRNFLSLSGAELQNVDLLGVRSAADSQSPLSVMGPGSLFSHQGSDHRMTINKATLTDTASVVFQTDWSGRAEFGLAGNDDFSVKVSADGANFTTALLVDKATGQVGFPNTNVSVGNAINLYQDAGRMSDANSDLPVGNFVFPAYLELYNGASVTGLGKFIHNNTDFGGNAGALDPSVHLLIEKIRHPSVRRYGLEFWVSECISGTGLASPFSSGGSTYYKSAYSRLGPSLSTLTWHGYLRAIDNPVIIRQRAPEMRYFKDGIEVSGDVEILPSDNWVALLLQWQVDTHTHLGYSPPYLDLYCLSAGDRWQMACPALIPGLTRIDPTQGVLAAYNMWPA